MSLIFRRPPLFGRRLFSSAPSTQRFLSFEEAREWARQSGVQTVRQWYRLGANRPSFIPFNPHQFYKGEFNGYHDWFGSITPGQRREQELGIRATDSSIRNGIEKIVSHTDGVAKIVDLARTHAPQFEFVLMPKHCTVDILFRPRGAKIGKEETWSGLHIRTSQCVLRRSRAGSRVTFQHIARAKHTGCWTICLDLINDVFHFLPAAIFETTDTTAAIAAEGGRGKYDNFRIRVEELGAHLEGAYEEGPQRCFDGWMEASFFAQKDRISQTALRQLRRYLFNPCQTEMSFCRADSVFNVKISGLNTVHRVATKRAQTERLEASLTHNLFGMPVPFDATHNIDLVIFSLRGESKEDVVGCFVFPKSVLVEHGYFSVDRRGGCNSITLYPPPSFFYSSCSDPNLALAGAAADRSTRVSRQRRDWRWQLDYFIDFGDGEECLRLSQSREKFRTILADLKGSAGTNS